MFFKHRFTGHLAAAAVIALVTALLFHPLLFGGFAMKWDAADYFVSIRHLAATQWQSGSLPLWNPFTQYGLPMHADPQSGAFYLPAALLGFLFGYDFTTLAWEFYLHVVLGGCGFYFLSRRLFGYWFIALLLGVSYACSGFFVGNAQHLSWVIAGGWLPWIGYFFLRLLTERTAMLIFPTALCFGLAATGSYPAFLIVTAYVLAVVWIVHGVHAVKTNSTKPFLRSTFLLFASVLVAVLYALFPLYAFAEGFALIEKDDTLWLLFQQNPFPFDAWFSFVLPGAAVMQKFFSGTDISMANAYVGFVPLLALLLLPFASRKREAIWCLALMLFFLLVALGPAAPLREWLFRFVPGMDKFRFPSLFRLFAMATFLLAVGYVLREVRVQNILRDKRVLTITGLVGFFAFAILLLTQFENVRNILSIDLSKEFDSRFIDVIPFQWTALSLFVALTAVALLLVRKNIRWVFAAVLILQSVNFVTLCRYNVRSTATSWKNASELDQQIALLDLQQIDVATPLGEVKHTGTVDMAPAYFNVNIFEKQIAPEGYNPFVLRTYDAFVRDTTTSGKAALSVSHANSVFFVTNDVSAKLSVKKFEPGNALVECTLESNATLVLQQANYPGWRCFVNGEEKPNAPLHNFLISVQLNSGVNNVEFIFIPAYLWMLWLMLLTGAALFAGTAWWIIKRSMQ